MAKRKKEKQTFSTGKLPGLTEIIPSQVEPHLWEGGRA